MGRLEGKVAIISGAASGIGRASAELFAQEGALLLLADVNDGAGAAVADSIRASGGRARFVRTDVTRSDEVAAAVKAAVDEYGGLDILFNNAGNVGELAPVAECTEENWDFLLALNLKSVFLGMKHAIPEMVRRGGGAVLNTSSTAGIVGFPGRPGYSAAKGGVVMLTKTAALEYAGSNIRVNCLCPGATLTPMLQHLEDLFPGRHDFLRSRIPLKRLAAPLEMAQVALFLVSDEASYLTGAVIPADGGSSAG